ncbi:hypothetical protein, partial [Marinomonas arenicola]
AKRALVPPKSAIKAGDIKEPYLIILKFYNKTTLKNTEQWNFYRIECNKITFYLILFKNLNTFLGTDLLRLFL